jgi:hypothetical protein
MKAGADFDALVAVTGEIASGGLGWMQFVNAPLWDGERKQHDKLVYNAGRAIGERDEVSLDIKRAVELSGDYSGKGRITVGDSQKWLDGAQQYTTTSAEVTSGGILTTGTPGYTQTESRRNYVGANFQLDVYGDEVIDRDYQHIRQDPSLPGDFYAKNRPPIEGIPFGDSEPTKTDVERIQTELGMTKESFKKLYKTLYGYDNPLQFLIDQWREPLNINKRARK